MLGADVHISTLVQVSNLLRLASDTIGRGLQQIKAVLFLIVQHRVRCHCLMVGEGAALTTRLDAQVLPLLIRHPVLNGRELK